MVPNKRGKDTCIIPDVCGKRINFELKEARKSHPRAFKKRSGSRCEFCNKHFSTKNNKKRHITFFHNNVVSPKKKDCETCSAVFDNLIDLKNHQSTHHNTKWVQQDVGIVDISDVDDNIVNATDVGDENYHNEEDEDLTEDHNGIVNHQQSSSEVTNQTDSIVNMQRQFEQQLQELQQQLQAQQLAKDNIQLKYDQLNIRYDKLENKLESENSEFKQIIQQRDDDIASFHEREKLSQKEIGALKNTIEHLNNNVSLLETKNKSLESNLKKMTKENQERVKDLVKDRSDLTKENDSLEKKLTEAKEIISFCKEAEIEDQITNIVKTLEMKSGGAYTLEKFEEDIQQQEDFQLEKKLTVGKVLGKIAKKIEKCQNCRNNLMKFLNKQKNDVDNVDN